MEKRREESEILSPEEKLKNELGHEPSEFELQLLAHPGDKNGTKKLAVELMFNEGVNAPMNFLDQIKDKKDQEEVNRLAVEFKETIEEAPKDEKERAEIKERQKNIRKQLQQIIDKTIDKSEEE